MKKLLTLLLLLFSVCANGQDFLGYANSNYAGITGVYLQPASIVDSRMKLDFSLPGFSISAYNNYIGLKPSALKRTGSLFGGVYPAFDDTAFQDKYLFERENNLRKSVYFANDIVILGGMFHIDRKSSIGLSWRVRTYANVDGIEPQLAKLIYEELNYPTFFTQLQNKRVSVQTMSWGEYGATYGRVLMDKGEHFLKGAVTLKILQGLQAAYMYVENLDYQFTTDSTLSLFSTDVNYGHSTNFEFTNESMKYKYISNFSVGFDIGAVYEFRPKHADFKYDMDGETDLWMRNKNKYKAKIGLSILDIGGIKFEKGQYSNDFHADVNFWNLDALKFDSIPVQAFDDTLRNRFGSSGGERDFYMNLPTAISLQADLNIWKSFYLNHTTYFAFQWTKNAHKVHDITTFSLTPRWDHKWFGASIPVTYNLMGNFATGVGIRLGPVIFGTSNISPIYAALTQNGKRDIFGADFYMLLKVPIPYGAVKDRDKDKVSDKKDKCIDVAGVWEFEGCPDRDGDHIMDINDACPDEPGTIEFKGCPDKDGDKIIDKEDACPENPGPLEFKGCPDKDGDKIIDKEDDCPDDAGLAEFKGCPDRDGDKIIDMKDDCPDEPGLEQFVGCPDRDGDGLRDIDDRCPDKPGPVRNLGCPERKLQLLTSTGVKLEEVDMEDNKFNFKSSFDKNKVMFKLLGDGGDTIKDVLVTSPDLRGKHAYRDADKLFRFPKEAEVIVLTEKEKEIVKKAFDNLEFATGKDVIKGESFSSLDELAGLLKEHKTWKLKIEGHTDNEGKEAANLLLSKKRAEAVKKYLVKKGVDATRFEVKWYGQTKPIASNDTPEGRQKNRRVEMTIAE